MTDVTNKVSFSLPSLLPPWCDRSPLLHSAHRLDLGFMGSHYSEPVRPRRHVLVLLPERPWRPHLVEGVGYSHPDHSVCH